MLGFLAVAGERWNRAQNEVYDGAVAAIEAGVAACRPGVTADALWTAVGSVLADRGIGCGYPLHGHSYGIGWESPWLVSGNETPIETGMAIAIECMAGTAELGFVKFEQNVPVHADRTELISTCPIRLQVYGLNSASRHCDLTSSRRIITAVSGPEPQGMASSRVR